MRTIIVGAVALVTTLFWSSGVPRGDDSEERTKVLAAAMNAIAPKDVGDGMTMTSVRADGATLVLAFEGVPTSDLQLPDFDRQIVAAICGDPRFRRVVAEDVDIRLDLLAGDGGHANVDVTECR